jgi:membrane-bound lytic murein transglycosylase B
MNARPRSRSRRRAICPVFVCLAVSLVACGDASSREQALPADPGELAAGLIAANGAWRGQLDEWRAAGKPANLPEDIGAPAAYVQRTARFLARRPYLRGQTLAQLPPRLASQTRQMAIAAHDLQRLSHGGPSAELEVGPPTPLDVLLPSYREGNRRFGIGVDVLAAVNFIESAFGQARNDSGAGARGPMQFIPSTWKGYGLGGNIRDPHDAILGAANYLDQSGAPQSYGEALFAYNRSRLYVDAVLRYAGLIRRDRETLYLFYSWRP